MRLLAAERIDPPTEDPVNNVPERIRLMGNVVLVAIARNFIVKLRLLCPQAIDGPIFHEPLPLPAASAAAE
jgi:hypothetical protein